MFENADEAIAKIEDDIRRAEKRAERLPELQTAIDAVRARAISRQRDVAVEVDAGGVVRELEISDAALERGGRRLSQDVLALIRSATQDARARTLGLTTEILGEEDPLVKVVAADLESDETGDHSWRFGGTGRDR
jgi:DNA-binding protein YbaB